MELKTTLNFEVTKNERNYRVSVPLGAPYGEAYDAVFSCLEGIVEYQRKSVEQLKSQATTTEPVAAESASVE
jgi:hypothetical protein